MAPNDIADIITHTLTLLTALAQGFMHLIMTRRSRKRPEAETKGAGRSQLG